MCNIWYKVSTLFHICSMRCSMCFSRLADAKSFEAIFFSLCVFMVCPLPFQLCTDLPFVVASIRFHSISYLYRYVCVGSLFGTYIFSHIYTSILIGIQHSASQLPYLFSVENQTKVYNTTKTCWTGQFPIGISATVAVVTAASVVALSKWVALLVKYDFRVKYHLQKVKWTSNPIVGSAIRHIMCVHYKYCARIHINTDNFHIVF